MVDIKTDNKTTDTKEEECKELAEKKLTLEEKECLANHRERSKRKPLKFTNTTKSGDPAITTKDVSRDVFFAKMTEALGTADLDLQSRLFTQAMETCFNFLSIEGRNNERLVEYSNYVMAILNGIQPQDEIEGMLAIQMVGVHNLAMETLKRAMLGGQSFEGKDVNVSQATKMLRTFIAQMEALKKYRTGGEQKMIVEHVHVNEGGQAIVSVVNQGGGKKTDE